MGIRDKVEKKSVMEIIDRGGHVQADNEAKKKEWINFCLRIKADMLGQIDKIVEERAGISKTGWILEAIQEKIKRTANDL